ncbi:MAG TPA: DUF3352 domain-containing protein [Patescibacteria group bacterium]|nr:DUF3352 domain-containing protein [Patescibacteria group bacterium]
MTANLRPAARPGAWRTLVIGLVAVLAVGIGTAAGAFLLNGRVSGAGDAATYVAADAPMYVELRLDPSTGQDAALRELLGRFPPIEGIDLDRPLYDQLGEMIDEQLAGQDEVELSWADDVEPWFDGRVAFAVTDIPIEAMAEPADPMAMPELPGMLVVIGVTDAAAARATIDRLTEEATHDVELVESEHRGTAIFAHADEGAYAVTDDAILFAPDAAAIMAALDTHADPDAGLAATDQLEAAMDALPADWLAFSAFDFSDVMAASFAEAADGDDAAAVAAMRALMEHQPMRGAMAVTAQGDRMAIDGVSDAPSGPFATGNADRGLAAEVPAEALYFVESGNIGEALGAVLEAVKEAAATDPEAAEQIQMAEAALGAELPELVAWIDDGAIAAGWDAASPWAGIVLVPSDVDAAARRLGQLATFATLAGLDPDSGVTVTESEIAGEEVTTIRWAGPDDVEAFGEPLSGGIVIEYTVTDDRAIIGIGDAFVRRALELDAADSLAADARYAATIEELGGTSNAGVVWLDLAATREAVMAAVAPMMAFVDPDGEFAASVEPWLLPLDRFASVTILDGDVLVQRAALFVE